MSTPAEYVIPGGAATQVGNTALRSGVPEQAIGLTPEQAQQARDMVTPPEPIPLFDTPQESPQEERIIESQSPQQGMEEVDITLPSGEEVTVVIPVGMSDEDVRNFLIDHGEKGFTPTGSTVDRFVYGFGLSENNITDNLGNYAKSHYPILATEITWTPDSGFNIKSASDIYGSDFETLSPQQRRERIKEVDAATLKSKYPDINPNNLGAAGLAGDIAAGIADPAIMIPGGQYVKGAKTVGQVAKRTAVTGGAWGGAWGASDVLQDEGAPTTLEELKSAAPKVLGPAAVGAVTGPVLGVTGYKIANKIRGVPNKKVFTDPTKTKNFAQQKYWPAIWEEQLAGKSAAEATTVVRNRFKLSLDDEWRLRQSVISEDLPLDIVTEGGKKGPKLLSNPQAKRQGSYLYSTATDAQDAMRRLGTAKSTNWGDPILHGDRQQYIDDVLRPIAGVVKDISPLVYKRLLDMEGRILNKSHEYHQLFHPFHAGVKKLSKIAKKADYQRFSKALFNGNMRQARDIWRQYGLELTSFDDMRFGLDRLEKEMTDTGIKFKKIGEYFPRLVEDYRGFRAATHQLPELEGLDKYIANIEIKKGSKLTEEEAVKVINDWMAYSGRGKTKKTISSVQKRTVHEVTDKLLPYYYDPATTLEFHLRETLSKIERNKFFGKHNVVMDKEGLENITDSVGKLVREQGLSAEQAARLASVLTARFGKGEMGGRSGFNALRQLTGGATLGNPISAMRNLADIYPTMRTQGVVNTMAALFKRTDPELSPQVFGYMLEGAQEMDMKGVGSKVRWLTEQMYRKGGFRAIDGYTKGILLKAAVRNAQKAVKTPKSKVNFIKKYADLYQPDELTQLIADLDKGVMSDLVKSHINAEVMRIQPISRSQMPKHYLDMPNGRMFYQFRTWGLNQLELFRQDVWRKIKSKDPAERREGARAAVFFLAGVGTSNEAITQAQKFITGRDTDPAEELPSNIIWQALGNFGLDRYSIERAGQTGDSKQFLTSFLPPSLTIPGNVTLIASQMAMGESEVDEGMRKALKATGFGRLIDFWFLGGAEEYNNKKAEERGNHLKF